MTQCKWLSWVLACGLGFPTSMVSAAESATGVMHLDAIASPSDWRASDGKVNRSGALQSDGRDTLHFHVPIASGGEASVKAWPKIWRPLDAELVRDWGKFDRFEFLVMARLQPALSTPPKKLAVQLLCPDKDHAATVSIVFAELDTWQRVSIPVADIPDLARLSSMQFYLANRWYSDVQTADFYLSGFRLVRDVTDSPGLFSLMTPLPSPAQPVLRLEASRGSGVASGEVPLRIGKPGKPGQDVSTRPSSSGLVEVDLTELELGPGRHQLTLFPEARERRQVFTFDWHPFKLIEARLGEGLAGNNVAIARVRNVSAEAGLVNVTVRLNGSKVAAGQLNIPPRSVAEARVAWPLRQDQQAAVQVEVHAADRYVGGANGEVDTPPVLRALEARRAVTMQDDMTLVFQVPVALAEGSRDAARFAWELRDPSGHTVGQGDSSPEGLTAEVRVDGPRPLDTGLYTLYATLRWGDGQQSSAQGELYVVPSPFQP